MYTSTSEKFIIPFFKWCYAYRYDSLSFWRMQRNKTKSFFKLPSFLLWLNFLICFLLTVSTEYECKTSKLLLRLWQWKGMHDAQQHHCCFFEKNSCNCRNCIKCGSYNENVCVLSCQWNNTILLVDCDRRHF